jgi:hypothetical protein
MPEFLRSIKLYLLIVLLPQLVYLLTNSHGLAAVCDSCSPSSYIDLYLRLLRDPSASFSHASASAETPYANTDGPSSVEYTEKAMPVEDHSADEYQDNTAAALCSCLSRESRNFSDIEESMAVQASSHDAQTVDGGWYVHVCVMSTDMHSHGPTSPTYMTCSLLLNTCILYKYTLFLPLSLHLFVMIIHVHQRSYSCTVYVHV